MKNIPYYIIGLCAIWAMIFMYQNENKIEDTTNTTQQQETNQVENATWIVFTWDFILSTWDILQEENVGIEQYNPHYSVSVFYQQHFVDNYKYEDSPNYFFALNIIDDTWYSVWYYNVFRNERWWVQNDLSHWLTWAIPANQIWRWDCNNDRWCAYFEIPVWEKIKVSKKNWEYWYKYVTLDPDKEYTFKMSPVKELPSDEIFIVDWIKFE